MAGYDDVEALPVLRSVERCDLARVTAKKAQKLRIDATRGFAFVSLQNVNGGHSFRFERGDASNYFESFNFIDGNGETASLCAQALFYDVREELFVRLCSSNDNSARIIIQEEVLKFPDIVRSNALGLTGFPNNDALHRYYVGVVNAAQGLRYVPMLIRKSCNSTTGVARIQAAIENVRQPLTTYKPARAWHTVPDGSSEIEIQTDEIPPLLVRQNGRIGYELHVETAVHLSLASQARGLTFRLPLNTTSAVMEIQRGVSEDLVVGVIADFPAGMRARYELCVNAFHLRAAAEPDDGEYSDDETVDQIYWDTAPGSADARGTSSMTQQADAGAKNRARTVSARNLSDQLELTHDDDDPPAKRARREDRKIGDEKYPKGRFEFLVGGATLPMHSSFATGNVDDLDIVRVTLRDLATFLAREKLTDAGSIERLRVTDERNLYDNVDLAATYLKDNGLHSRVQVVEHAALQDSDGVVWLTRRVMESGHVNLLVSQTAASAVKRQTRPDPCVVL